MTLHWELDPTGYPLLYIAKHSFWMQFFPVTKPQFEQFLSYPVQSKLRRIYSRVYDTDWYHGLLTGNPRVSFNTLDDKNYERLFLTGVFRNEVDDFIRWFNSLSPGFRLPTDEQWRNACQWLSGFKAIPTPPTKCVPMNPAALHIWHSLWKVRKPDTLQQQAMFGENILEHVSYTPPPMQAMHYAKPQAYAMGTPRSSFHHNARNLYQSPATFNLDSRQRQIGFRLIKVEK